jgi:hypothetical protein
MYIWSRKISIDIVATDISLHIDPVDRAWSIYVVMVMKICITTSRIKRLELVYPVVVYSTLW